MAELYRAADLFATAATSPFETFGRASAEALACGTPAVAPRFDGFVEVLAQPGGFLVEVEIEQGRLQVSEEGMLRAVYEVLSSSFPVSREDIAEAARRVIRSFLDSEHFQSVHFVWHGGEPLLRGRRFFEALLAEQNAHPTRVSYTNATQTNATHLDDEMLDFLLANGFRIGLSLDGPESLNDGSRQMRDSADPRSARATTVDAAKRLKKRGQSRPRSSWSTGIT